MHGKKMGGKEVKSGGRMTTKMAGSKPQGRPGDKVGGGSRGEFAVQTGGNVAGGLGKRGEFTTERAGG